MSALSRLARWGVLALGLVLGLIAAGPASAASVTPEFKEGNPSCTGLGYDFGFKVDPPTAGTYQLGGGQSITLTRNGEFFSWTSTIGIDAVIGKGGPNANLYVYDPPAESFGDTQLSAPLNGTQPFGLSHVEFCYDLNLTATKTATAKFTRTYTWSIDKTVAPASHTGFAGDQFSSDYDVAVDQTVVDSDFRVEGTITVNNPTPLSVNFTVTDSVGGTPATVSCPTLTLAAGASTVCTYGVALESKTDGTNTATITSTTQNVDGATASANYAFGNPTTTVGFPTVNVTDSVEGSLGSASGDKTFEYTNDFKCPPEISKYTDGKYEFEVPNTATITETGQSDGAKVTVTCYAPLVLKTAQTSYTREYDWTIDKQVDKPVHVGWAGDAFTSTYTVGVKRTVDEYDFLVQGVISVKNPSPSASMTVQVTDTVGQTPAVVDCDPLTQGDQGSLTVPAGQTKTCTYRLDLGDGDRPGRATNTATATINGAGFTGTATVDWDKATVITVGFEAVDVTDTNAAFGGPWAASGTTTFPTYDRIFTCPTSITAYTKGKYTETFPNTAEITQTGDKADQSVTLTCYAPLVAKTADAQWTQGYTWKITKGVTPDALTGLIGQTGLQANYTVAVDRTEADAFSVDGKITITNLRPDAALTVNVADAIGQTAAAITCPQGADPSALVVPAGQSVTCTYTVDLGTGPKPEPGNNIATVTIPNGTAFSASAAYSFPAEPKTTGFPTVNVTDSFNQGPATALGPASGDATFPYPRSFDCPSDPSAYDAAGRYTKTFPNTAQITETEQSASAEVTLTCYAPLVEKTAQATFARDYTWTIDKQVDQASFTGVPGQVFTPRYTVGVVRNQADRDFTVSGTITVTNPAPATPMTLEVTDTLGQGLPPVAVDCDPNTAGAQSTVTLAGGESRVCTYTVDLGDSRPQDGVNTATATLILPSQEELGAAAATVVTASAPYVFPEQPTTTTGPATVSVTDTFNNGGAETLGVASGTTTFPSYPREVACAANIPAGTTSEVRFPNTARIVETNQSASREVVVTCTAPPTPPPPPAPPVQQQVTPPPPAPPVVVNRVTRARLSIDKRAPARVSAGQVVRYRITVRNTSRVLARNVVITDTIPSGMALVARTRGLSVSRGQVAWRVGDLRPGASRTVVLNLSMPTTATGQRCNVAGARATNAAQVQDRACTQVTPIARRVVPAVTG